MEATLGPSAVAVADWALLLGYGGAMLACLLCFGFSLNHLLTMLWGHPVSLIGGSILIVLALCLVVLRHGGSLADLAAFDPIGDTAGQIRSGLMVAMLRFIGFESAATLGAESLRPERAVTRAFLLSVLIIGVLFCSGLWCSPREEMVAGGPAERS